MTDSAPSIPDLTWPALLARWTAFAQSSLALPRTALGDRWRAAVPGIIALQAVTYALAEVGGLPAAERPLACDRAAVLIDRHAAEFARLWPAAGTATNPEPLPEALGELLADARLALAQAKALAGTPSAGHPDMIPPSSHPPSSNSDKDQTP